LIGLNYMGDLMQRDGGAKHRDLRKGFRRGGGRNMANPEALVGRIDKATGTGRRRIKIGQR